MIASELAAVTFLSKSLYYIYASGAFSAIWLATDELTA